MWAIFSVYGACPNAPEALTMWAKYAIYEGIDKIPQICHGYGYMWSKMDYGGVKWSVPLHVYLITYISVVFTQELVVYFMVDHL